MGGLVKVNVGVLAGPGPGGACGCEAAGGEGLVEGLVAAGGDGHDGGEVGGGAGAFVRRGAGPDDLAGEVIVLRHDEGAEVEAGLLVPDAAVRRVLKGEHPVEVPLHFGEVVGDRMTGLGNVEREVVEGVGIHLPCPEEGAGGDAGVDDVAAVVAGVVPAAGVRNGPERPEVGSKAPSRWQAGCL